MTKPLPPLEWDPKSIQLKGFSRGVAEIQWLLVALVLLYLLLAQEGSGRSDLPALAATGIYFLFSLGVSLLGMVFANYRWLVALHVWIMTAFITWLLFAIDGIDGPLVSLYLLAVITSALALGRLATMLQVGVVAACYLLLLYHLRGEAAFAGQAMAIVSAHVLMFLLVGYLTTVLADAIHFANDRLRVLAHTDAMTGLYNRSALNSIIRPLFAGAKRDERPFSVMLIDMDRLKAINDGFGHEAGDQAIESCAKILQSSLRESDVLARHGGDEFAAFLPNTRDEEAVILARRIIEAAQGTRIAGGQPLMSIGIASYPQHGATINELLSRADAAMYEIKRAGGNSVAVYSG